MRLRRVSVKTDVLAHADGSPRATSGDRITLNLFADVAFTLVVKDVTRHAPGSHTWSGELEGIPHGAAALALHDGIMAATVLTPGGSYRVGQAADGSQVVEEVDQSLLPPEAPPLAPSPLELEESQAPQVAADDASQIDVLVVYTATARIAAGGAPAIQAEIASAVALTNQNPSFCGIAWLMTANTTAFERWAFSVVDRLCVVGLTFAHELDHNMGAHHDPFVAGSAQTLFPFSHGYVDVAARFRTIMAYNDQCGLVFCTRIPFFSTPSQTYNGSVMGTASASDNARTLGQTGNTVASFRAALVASPLDGFISGFYTQVLGRGPDPAGVAGWRAFLQANPNSAGAAAFSHGFLESTEYLDRALTLAGHVGILYRAFLDRAPDAPGQAYWVNDLVRRYHTILPGFITSDEFQGLRRTLDLNAFVTRFYQQILGRAPEPPGLADWVQYLDATNDIQGFAEGFLDSAEYLGTARTVAQHVTILYRAFLDREPDDPGLAWWVNAIARERAAVEDGFIGSPEFQARFAGLF